MNINKLLYTLLLSAITIAGFSMYKQNDLGQISFSFAEFSFETNLVVFSAAILCALFIIFVFVKTIQAITGIFFYFKHKRHQYHVNKARLSMSQGLIEYAEGRFQQSEKTLLQHIKYSDNRLQVYLTAARAAQQLGAYERRDEYLQLAHLDTPNADLAINLTKAELQLAHNQNEQALATLTQLNELSANHSYVLTLLANTYNHLQDWDKLKEILPKLKKYGSLSAESFLSFEISVCNGQISNLAKHVDLENNGTEALIQFWKETPQHLKILPDVIEHYVKQLIFLDAEDHAEKVLRQYLTNHWHESSIILYSELDVTVDSKRMEMAEKLLKNHPHNAYLLLALGKMCISSSLWGKARTYLESSIAITPTPENYLKLARLLEENMNDPAGSQQYYRQGLHLLAGQYCDEITNKDTFDVDANKPLLKIVKT